MTWKLRSVCFLIGLAMSQLTPSSNAQVRLNSFDLLQLQMQSSARTYEEDKAERERSRLKAEFEADQKHYKFTLEILGLYSALAEQEGHFFALKWDDVRQFDFKADQAARAVRQELLRRQKDIEKHLKK